MTITCLYSCEGCQLTKVKVDVPVRGPEESLETWMRQTQQLVGADHRRRSPLCRSNVMQELAIPITGRGGRVGGPVQH